MIKWLLRLYFDLTGWKYIDNRPKDLKKFIAAAAPHTSNWDFMVGMSILSHSGIKASFAIKQEWMKGLLGWFLKKMGAFGVDRNAAKEKGGLSYTDQMANKFKESDELVMMVSPEGTRSRNNNWKTGFYYTAQKANVPIVLGFGDWSVKEAGFGKVIYPTDFEKDMKEITEYYRNVEGKNPQNFVLDSRWA